MSGSILKAVSLGSQHTQEKFSLVKQPAGREPQFFYSTESHWEIWYKKMIKFEVYFRVLSLHMCRKKKPMPEGIYNSHNIPI